VLVIKRTIVDEVVKQCKTILGETLVSVVMFGSVARGIQNARSDIDLLIVVEKEVKKDFLKDIWTDFLLKYSVELDMIVMTKQDVIDNFDHFSPLFVSFALGVTILVDDGFFEREYFTFLKVLQEEDIKYVEGGKVWDLKKVSSEILP
jgi:predicted nucleotidyltransferase